MPGDRERTLAALAVARAWRDPGYEQRLLNDPRSVLTEIGIDVPEGVEIRVLQDTHDNKHVVLPPNIDPNDPAQAQALLRALVPVPSDSQATLVQSTSTIRHFVIPHRPENLDPAVTSETAMAHHASSGTVATYHDAAAVTEAVQTEAVVTTTTEAQDVETSTTAAAEAEVVAVVAGVLI